MNSRGILLFPLILLVFSGCWVDEAAPEKVKALHIVADSLTAEDSTLFDRFAKRYHVTVHAEILEPEALLQRVRNQRYNAEIDVLMTENAQLRQQLNELKALKTIHNTTVFSQLERQFNNRHHYWLPVSHDPLLVTYPKDTSNACRDIDFRSWHRNDSIRPVLTITRNKESYVALLGASAHLNWMVRAGSKRQPGIESVYALSEFAAMQQRRDSLYQGNAHACRAYLVDNRRYITRVNTLSLYRYGRNGATAEQFLLYFAGNAYAVASGRNQLPTRKHTDASWTVRSLSIR